MTEYNFPNNCKKFKTTFEYKILKTKKRKKEII